MGQKKVIESFFVLVMATTSKLWVKNTVHVFGSFFFGGSSCGGAVGQKHSGEESINKKVIRKIVSSDTKASPGRTQKFKYAFVRIYLLNADGLLG